MNLTDTQRFALDQIALEAHDLDEGVRHDLSTDPCDWANTFDRAADWSRKDGDGEHAALWDDLAARTRAVLDGE